MNRTLKNLADVIGIKPNTLAIKAREGMYQSIRVCKPKGWKKYMYVLIPELIKTEFGQEVYDQLYRN